MAAESCATASSQSVDSVLQMFAMGTPAVIASKGQILSDMLSPGHVRGSVRKLLVSAVNLILTGLHAQ